MKMSRRKIDGIDFAARSSVAIRVVKGLTHFSKDTEVSGRFFPELELSLALFIKPNQDISGKKLTVNGKARAGDPHIIMKAMRKGDKLPNTQIHNVFICWFLNSVHMTQRIGRSPAKILSLPARSREEFSGRIFRSGGRLSRHETSVYRLRAAVAPGLVKRDAFKAPAALVNLACRGYDACSLTPLLAAGNETFHTNPKRQRGIGLTP